MSSGTRKSPEVGRVKMSRTRFKEKNKKKNNNNNKIKNKK